MMKHVVVILLIAFFNSALCFRGFLHNSAHRPVLSANPADNTDIGDQLVRLLEATKDKDGKKGDLKMDQLIKALQTQQGVRGLKIVERKISASNANANFNSYMANSITKNIAVSNKKLGTELGKNYIINNLSTKSLALSNKAAGRSEIIEVLEKNTLRLYLAKISKEKNRYDNDIRNYEKIGGKFNSNSNSIVNIVEVDSKMQIYIMEKGNLDLKQVIDDRSQPLRGKELKYIMRSMARIVGDIHSRGYVWCDLKLENFILVPKSTTIGSTKNQNNNYSLLKLKAIDFESITKEGDPATEFSPEVMSPEQAELLISSTQTTIGGRVNDIKITPLKPIIANKKNDIFALGLCYLHLYLGQPFLGSNVGENIQKLLEFEKKSGVEQVLENDVNDFMLRSLLKSMLTNDPRKRPSISQIRYSPYLLFP